VSKARVGILGATGYTAFELLKILLRHPHVEVVLATSRKDHGTLVSHTHPALHGLTDLKLEPFVPEKASQLCDVIFSCLPHAASAASVRPLVDAGTRVVDFSADYRLNDIETYNQWYGGDHPDPDRVGSTPYGLPELFGDQLADALLVANPGCYPTSAILPLAPLIRDGKIATDGIIVDAKSGVSGAGRTPKLATLFGECNESITAYSVNTHRHGPEIGQIITRFSGAEVDVIFTPHLVPMYRGILATIYAEPAAGVTASDVLDHWRTFYSGHPFIRVVEHLPATKFTSNTNYCDMTARDAGGRLILLCSLDNLMKGASGAAVQNLNQMMGWPADSGF
jgi:N-acetyl-gamma-glutamyl-phosphate reductase